MKRILSILVCLAVIITNITTLCGCGTSKVSNSQITADIRNSDFIQQSFKSDFVYDSPNNYKTHKIIKRQTNIENKEDIIICKILASNNYFNITYEVKLEYTYYDEGGWVLDSTDTIHKIITPTAKPEKELIIQYLFDITENKDIGYITESFDTPSLANGYPGFYADSGADWYVRDRKMDLSVPDIEFGSISVTYNSNDTFALLPATMRIDDMLEIKGDFRIFFSQEKGWDFIELTRRTADGITKRRIKTPVFEVKESKYDYSSALGKFGSKNVNDIDTKNKKVTINGEKFNFEPLGLNGLVNYVSETGYKFYYNNQNDSWKEYSHYGGSYTYHRN